MNVMPTLVRRELWEHKALWIAPLAVAALILLSMLMPGRGHDGIPHIVMDGHELGHESRAAVFAVLLWALTIPQLLVMMIVLFFYATDCLYAERRDRSILFWKSMPVSDAQTVLAKLLVALVLVPLGVYALALVTDLLAAGILQLRFAEIVSRFMEWDAGVWLQVQGLMLLGLLIAMLWYAPVVAYLLLVSAWARRNVVLWVVLPPILAMIGEEIAFNTDYVKNFLGHRLGGVWGELGLGRGLSRLGEAHSLSLGRMIEAIDATPVLTSLHLWLGVAAAAALVFAAIRIRRYRDDT